MASAEEGLAARCRHYQQNGYYYQTLYPLDGFNNQATSPGYLVDTSVWMEAASDAFVLLSEVSDPPKQPGTGPVYEIGMFSPTAFARRSNHFDLWVAHLPQNEHLCAAPGHIQIGTLFRTNASENVSVYTAFGMTTNTNGNCEKGTVGVGGRGFI